MLCSLGGFPLSLRAGSRILAGACIALSGLGTAETHAQIPPGGQTFLTIGRASHSAERTYKRLWPIAEYLASRLGDIGIRKGQVLLAADNRTDTLVDLVKQGKIDLVITTPFPTAVYNRRAGVTPVMMAMRRGSLYYRTYFFVRKDSNIKSVGDLIGRVVAFEDPGSTSAYFLPLAEMKIMGHDLTELKLTDDHVPDDRIGFVFAGSEINISTWTFFGKVSGGVLSSNDWEDMAKLPRRYRQNFRIIHKTREIPRMLVSARSDLNSRLLQRIRQELQCMHLTPDGKSALKSYKLEQFVPLSESPERILSPVFELLRASRMEFHG